MTEIYTAREMYWIIRSAINSYFDAKGNLNDISDRYVVLDGLDDLYIRLTSAEDEVHKHHLLIEELKETIDGHEYKEPYSSTCEVPSMEEQSNFMEG